MLTSIRGSDKGNALMMALVLIIILSTLFVAVVPRIIALNDFSSEYMARVIRGIEQENREIRARYDL